MLSIIGRESCTTTFNCLYYFGKKIDDLLSLAALLSLEVTALNCLGGRALTWQQASDDPVVILVRGTDLLYSYLCTVSFVVCL